MSHRGSICVSSHRALGIALTIFSLCVLTLLPGAGLAASPKTGVNKAKANSPNSPETAVTRSAVQPGNASPAVAQAVRYGKIPLSFEPNQGQLDSRVSFLARGLGYALFLTPQEAVLELKSAAGKQMPVVRMKLEGT